MQKVKITLGSKRPHTYNLPDVGEMMYHPYGDALMMFGVQRVGKKNYQQCFGIGTVLKISKGESFDLVYMKFGKKTVKTIMAINNHARRMIYTLKKGQLATFYGYGRVFTYKKENEIRERQYWQFYAWGFQGWYTPKLIDVKKIQKEPDFQVDSMSVKEQDYMSNFLDQFDKTEAKESE